MLHKPITPTKAWLLYVCLLTLMAGCSKCNKVIEPDKTSTTSLPAATQTGAGTFGCMLNGQAWIPQGRGNILGPANPSVNYDATFEGGAFAMGGIIYAGDKLKQHVYMSGLGINVIGEYNLTNSGVKFGYIDFDSSDEYLSNQADTKTSNAKLIITKLDKTNQIIAGTFSFTMENIATGKKVTVTDGRFDMKYL